jgi:hypothetical protein
MRHNANRRDPAMFRSLKFGSLGQTTNSFATTESRIVPRFATAHGHDL